MQTAKDYAKRITKTQNKANIGSQKQKEQHKKNTKIEHYSR